MKLGIRGKLFFPALAMILLAGLASGAFLGRGLRSFRERQTEAELLAAATVARTALEAAPTAAGTSLPVLLGRLSSATGVRLAVLDASGGVLADSHPKAPWPELANPQSPAMGEPLTQMVAVPLAAGGLRGTVRAMRIPGTVDGSLRELRALVLWATLVGVGVAVFLSVVATHLATRALRTLVGQAGAIARGATPGRLAVRTEDELGGLAGSINELADQLQHNVAALTRERDRFAAMLESMGEAVLALDRGDRITLANGAAIRLLALPAEPVGLALVEVCRAPEAQALLAGTAEGREETAEFALRSGQRVLAHAAPLPGGAGTLLVMRDVSELRRLEAVRRDFVANVSHELRTPVSVVLANAETLQSGALADAERAREFVDAIVRNAQRLARLVSDLLDISRMEAGRYSLTLSSQGIAAALQRAADAISVPAQAKGIAVDVRCSLELVAMADSKALDQVLLNLVDNAVKYTPDRGQVRLRAAGNGEGVQIEVEDDGPGIPAPHHDRIFERFYRVDPGRSRELGGTGLGLAIVKHLVGAMGGAVGVVSVEPHGCRFWVRLQTPPVPRS